MDLMQLSKRKVLHIVNRDTKFSAVAFISTQSTAAVWQTFMDRWVTIYVGFLSKITVDQGPHFQSADFNGLLALAGIEKRDAGVESHNALGGCQRYHEYLRFVNNNVRTDTSTID